MSQVLKALPRCPQTLCAVLRSGPDAWWSLPLVLGSAAPWDDSSLDTSAAALHAAAQACAADTRASLALAMARSMQPVIEAIVGIKAREERTVLGAFARCTVPEREQHLWRYASALSTRSRGSPSLIPGTEGSPDRLARLPASAAPAY